MYNLTRLREFFLAPHMSVFSLTFGFIAKIEHKPVFQLKLSDNFLLIRIWGCVKFLHGALSFSTNGWNSKSKNLLMKRLFIQGGEL